MFVVLLYKINEITRGYTKYLRKFKEFKILMIKITEMKRKFSSWVTVSYARPYLRLNNTDLHLLVSFIKIILFNQLGPYMIYTQ